MLLHFRDFLASSVQHQIYEFFGNKSSQIRWENEKLENCPEKERKER
jgi:hypothetical protein